MKSVKFGKYLKLSTSFNWNKLRSVFRTYCENLSYEIDLWQIESIFLLFLFYRAQIRIYQRDLLIPHEIFKTVAPTSVSENQEKKSLELWILTRANLPDSNHRARGRNVLGKENSRITKYAFSFHPLIDHDQSGKILKNH